MNTSITPGTGTLNFETAAAIIARIRYRPGWEFRLRRYLGGAELYFEGPSVDAYDHGKRVTLAQSRVLPALHQITPTALVGFVYTAVQMLEAHELDEFFVVDGKRPYDPHAQPPCDVTLCSKCGRASRPIFSERSEC